MPIGPAGFCPAQFSSCYETLGGTIIGINGHDVTVFIPGGTACSQGDDCTPKTIAIGTLGPSGPSGLGPQSGPTIGPASDANQPTIGPAVPPEKPSCFAYYVNELTGGTLSSLASFLFRDSIVDKAGAATSSVMYDVTFRAAVKEAVPGVGMTPSNFAWLGRTLKWTGVAAAALSDFEAAFATGKMVKAKFSGGCTSPSWPFPFGVD